VVDAARLKTELEANRGHPVFVNFWASWCEPCMEEFPQLVRAANTWRARGVRFVSVSADEANDLTPVRRTMERFGAQFDSVLVASGDVDALIQQVDPQWTGALPASFLYDASGAQIRRVLGPIDAKTLEQWLALVLGDRAGDR
jgi:thiol-disulfide isomerase/thioredoxin